MSLYEPKQLADSMRVVRKNTIAIAEDIPEPQYDYRPTPAAEGAGVRSKEYCLKPLIHVDFFLAIWQSQITNS
jgi:hypothetical protein